MTQVISAFAVPFAISERPESDQLNVQLRDLFLHRESLGGAYRNARSTMPIGNALFESEFGLFDWQEPCVQQLRAYCFNTLFNVIANLNGYDEATMRRMRVRADAWFHITRNGGYFRLHNHAMASWSGVYCVDPGDPSPDDKDSGLLSFVNPMATSAMFMDSSIYRLKPPFGYAPREFRLSAGQLILFPSSLLHQVLPYQGRRERITVAFNSWFNLEQAETGAMP